MTRANHVPAALALVCVTLAPILAFTATETQVMPGWYAKFPVGTGSSNKNIYTAVAAATDKLLYLGGIFIDATSMETMAKSKSLGFRSQNSGDMIQDIGGDIGGLMLGGAIGTGGPRFCQMTDLKVWHTMDDTGYQTVTAWAACGEFLGLSPNGGTYDETFDAPSIGDDPDIFTALHLFDENEGAVGSASGNIYTFKRSPDDGSVTFTPGTISNRPGAEHPDAIPEIVDMYWLDRHNGWAVATDGEEITDTGYEGNEIKTQSYYATRVYRTTDGGRNWSLLSTIEMPNEDQVHQIDSSFYKGPMTFDGGWMARRIAMVDPSEGFLALAAYDNTQQHTVVVKLLRTIDGGANWSDCRVNMQIGSMAAMFGLSQPVLFSEIGGMYFWRDQNGIVRGRVAGSSFLTKGGSSGGGNPPSYYAATFIQTSDGGATWDKAPVLGDIEYDAMGGGAPVCKTARILDADFIDQFTGFAVGDEGTIFRFRYKCTTQSQCEFGYFCNTEDGADKLTCKSCALIGETDHPGSIDHCAGWEPPPEPDPELFGRDVIESDNAGQDGMLADATGDPDNGTSPDSGDSSGCQSTGSQPATTPFLIIGLAALAGLAFRRRQTMR